jgi:uracil-DNA glycosylase family 4
MKIDLKLVEPTDDNPFGKPEHCRNCTLFSEPGPVFGDGNRAARIFYLGEGPGADEVDWSPSYDPERHGPPRANMRIELPKWRDDGKPPSTTVSFRQHRMKPFVGGSGRIRNALLKHASLDKDVHLFTSNCVKCRPPANRLPTQHEVACCAPFLIQELEDVNPNLIIAAGELALSTVTGKSKIGLWRGVPTLGAFGKKVFPTWHPANVMRVQWNWPFAVHDLARAKVESTFPEIRRIPVNIDRRASLADTRSTLLADIRARGACTFDFETTGLTPDRDSIRMCGFVGRPDQANVYDWTSGAQQLFQEIFDDPTVEICGQNILYFDLPFAEEKGHRVRWEERIFDTMVAFHLANSSYGQTSIGAQNAGNYQGARGTEKDLSFIASNHTDIEYWKSKEQYKNDLYGVCGVDVIATDRSAYHPVHGLKAELASYDMLDLYYKHVLPVHLPLRRMTQRGVKIDEDRAARWAMMLESNANQLESTLKEGLGYDFNMNSPQQLMDLLYNKLGLPVQYIHDKKRGKRPTANAEAIEILANLAPENKILGTIVDIRHLRKMNSTYVQPGLVTGYLHPRFGVSKAANGRFNGQDPNAQNVPEIMRDIWIPDSPEHVLLSADSSQIEWRVAMVLSGDPVGLELLASGVDNHRAVAAETLGKRIEDISDAERHASKFIVYGLGYGRGAASIAAGHNLDLSFVDQFISRFFARFKVFHAWREALPEQVRRDHFLANPFKRRRWWYTREITEIYNFPASSTAADMMYEEIIQLERQLPKDATLRLTVHDEVVLNVPKDIVRETINCVRSIMQAKWELIVNASARPENVRRHYPDGWFCPADVHVGTNWKMCKSKDPQDKVDRAKLEKELGL